MPIVWESGWSPWPVWRDAEKLAPPGFDPQTNRSIIIIIIIIIVSDEYISEAQILSTGYEWTFWGSNPTGTRLSVPFETCPGAFPGVKCLGRDADHPSPGAGLRTDRRDTSASTGMSWGDLFKDSVDVTSVGCRSNLTVSDYVVCNG